jgi:hypothetical protein
MATSRKQKYNYKIFNRKTGKYYSSNSKSTWQYRSGVSYHLKNNEDWEVHIFPLSDPIIKTAKEFFEEEAMAEMDRKLKKLSVEERKRKEEIARQYLEDLRKLKEIQDRIIKYENASKTI